MKLFSVPLLFVVLAQMANGCSKIDQGIQGEVRWLEGNLMPTISEDPAERAPQHGAPVEREILIYELTPMEQAEGQPPLFSKVNSTLVQQIKTNDKGQFAVELPAGRYSVFVKEEEGLFANQFDGAGNINPITVYQDSVQTILIEVNYKAAY
jgi:hypothetical protein